MKILGAFLLLLAGVAAGALGDGVSDATAQVFPPRTGWHLILPGEVIDGDTFVFYWVVRDTCRLHGIQAPELRDHGGAEAKEFLKKILPKKLIPVHARGKEKYGRSLLEVYDGVNPVSISEQLIKAGHAKAWDGRGVRP